MSTSLFSELYRRRCWSVLLGMLLAASALSAEDTSLRRISTAEAMKAARFKIQPEYPAIARQLRVGGTVEVDVQINSAGEVDKVTVVNGDVLLAKSVISAVKKWKFTLTGDAGSEIIARLSFRFDP